MLLAISFPRQKRISLFYLSLKLFELYYSPLAGSQTGEQLFYGQDREDELNFTFPRWLEARRGQQLFLSAEGAYTTL
jgi:hypothetical protein